MNVEENTFFSQSTIGTSTYPKLVGKFNAAAGRLTNPATIDPITGFIGWIGGPIDGSTTIDVDVDTGIYPAGLYEFSIKYISGETRVFKIDVNGVGTGVTYKAEPTNGWSGETAKIFTVLLQLKTGTNTIKLHGDGKSYAPNFGEITVNIVFETFPAIEPPPITEPIIPPTIDPTIPAPPATTIPTTSTVPVPSTVPSNSTYPILVGKFNAAKGKLTIPAILEPSTGFAGWIGGPMDGSTTIEVTVDNGIYPVGMYQFLIKYISGEFRGFKIDVNGLNTGIIYRPEPTSGWAPINAKTFTVLLQLKTGTNTIKLHGDGKNYAPSFGEITVNITMETFQQIQPTPVTPTVPVVTVPTTPTIPQPSTVPSTVYPILVGKFDAAKGALTKPAIVETTGFAGWIGGPLDGSTTIDVTVDNGVYAVGMYQFIIKYISGEFRGFKIDVNGTTTGVIYRPEPTNGWTPNVAKIVIVLLPLKTGVNKIKFHGDGTNYAPSFGEVTVNIIKETFLGIQPPITPTIPQPPIIDPTIPTPVVPPTPPTIPSNTTYPILVGRFDAAKGQLSNQAIFDPITGFAGWIGGPLDGSTTIEVNVNNGIYPVGMYQFIIKYISGEPRGFKIDVNDVSTGVTYRPEPTMGWTANNAKIYVIPLALKTGVNKIKLHGDGRNYAPSFGEVTVNIIMGTFPEIQPTPVAPTVPAPTPVTTVSNTSAYPILVGKFDAAKGTLVKPAILEASTGFAGWIGGPLDGSTTIEVNVNNGIYPVGMYQFLISYISGEFRGFKIDINDVNTGIIYRPTPTNNWTASGAKIFAVQLPLKTGVNKIKFHGDGKNYAPSFGMITVNIVMGTFPEIQPTPTPSTVPTPTPVTAPVASFYKQYLFSDVQLFNGAHVDTTGFIVDIGGVTDGSINLIAEIPIKGIYNLTINYITGDIVYIPDATRPLVIDVNNVNTGTVYKLPITYGVAAMEPKTFVVQLNLETGINNIKLHGNNVDRGPQISKMTIESSKIMSSDSNLLLSTYEISLGTLNGDVQIDDSTNLTTNLGGPNDNSSTVLVSVPTDGAYILGIRYLSGDTDRVLNLDINNNSVNNGYKLPLTNSWDINDINIYYIDVTLNAGNNTIKFHGDGTSYAPHLREFTVESKMPSAVSNIVMVGSAVLKGSFIEGIGTEKNGQAIVFVNVQYQGVYDFAIHYVADDNNKKIKVDVNGINTGVLYDFAMTSSMDKKDERVMVIKLPLISGQNIIRIYN